MLLNMPLQDVGKNPFGAQDSDGNGEMVTFIDVDVDVDGGDIHTYVCKCVGGMVGARNVKHNCR